jgi:cellobiose phosphorylase
VRENGGQYSHAAIWTLMAFAALGDKKKTYELFSMVQPVNHALNQEEVQVYKVEPYVMAADVYANKTHRGRGGWTWYTGSAGWLYRLITESFLGLQKEGNKLKIVPCVPEEWKSFKVRYRYMSSVYHIFVTQKNSSNEMMVIVDGVRQEDKMISLADDGKEHNVQIILIIDMVTMKEL